MKLHRSAALGAATVMLGLAACGDDTPMTPDPTTGSIEVNTTTTGSSLDDSFMASVDGGTALAVGANSAITFSDIETGTRSVELTDVAPNCTVAGDNPRTVTVTDGGTTTTEFEVSCLQVAQGQMMITSDRSGNSEIYLTDEDGSNPVNVTNNPADDIGAAISPDGTRFVFSSDRTGNNDVFIANIDGSGVTNLTSFPGTDALPTWSPDGTRITFTSERDGAFDLWLMDPDGTNLTNLTDNGATNQLATWSPDGSRIAFVSNLDGNSDIWVMNADGTGQTNLTDDPSSDTGPAWSPDGTTILFQTSRDGNDEIYAMDPDGTNLVNLTNDPADDQLPNWSPNGDLIAFTSDRDGPDREVYIMTAAGVGATQITDNDDDDLAGPIQGWR